MKPGRQVTGGSARQQRAGLPRAQGLYDPALEHDSCGIGFVVNIRDEKSRKIVEDGLLILQNLAHRGAVGADPKAADGAGILVQLPHAFFAAEAERLGFALPGPGDYGVGQLFMPRDPGLCAEIVHIWEQTAREEGLEVIGWREVPADNSVLGETVKPSEPAHRQVFIARTGACADEPT